MVNFISAVVLAGTLIKPEFVDCHLWKRVTDVTGQRICIYRGKNSTYAQHFVSVSWSECPKMWRCPYQPKNKSRPTIGEIMDGINGGFK